ncbi:Rpn family recombination-promoting nuclease/putative transposase [Nocardia inohanensis]|uniref:Rpn family recombination-promoting nuclease/putative transposase n=1 Tax=Nocardia inohanensis TaxID=209246 RepID=UPI0009FD998B
MRNHGRGAEQPTRRLRLLEYIIGIWNHYLNQHPKAERLPAVIPLVVHASPTGRHWNTPRTCPNSST